MTAEMTTVVGQLNIVGGTWRGDAPNQVAVREPRSADVPGAGKGDLFVLTEVLGDAGGRQVLERELAEAIRDAYYLSRGSITASLRRALQKAGELLYNRNYPTNVEERVIGGAVVLVMCSEDVFVAQIGPAALFAVLGNYIRRYPAESAWLDEALGPERIENEPALGFSSLIEPNLHHLRVRPDDVLVLADSGLAAQLPLPDLVKAVEGHNVKRTVKNLGKAAQSSDCSALVLSVMEHPESGLGPLKRAKPVQFGRSSPPETSHPTATKTSAQVPTFSEPMPEVVAKPEPESEQRDDETGVRHHPLLTEDDNRQRAVPDQELHSQTYERTYLPSDEEDRVEPEERKKRARIMASTMPESAFNPEVRRGRPEMRAAPVRRIFRSLSMGLFMFIALLGNGLKAIFGFFAPKASSQVSPQAGSQAHRRQSSPVSWALLRTIALAIPLLVAVIVGVSYLQKGRIREAEYRELVSAAQNKFEQAQAVDRDAAFGLVAEAEASLIEAEKIKVDQPEIADLRQKMAEQVDRLGNVQRLYYLPQLRQYTDSGTQLKNIIVQGVEVYIFDAGNNRVFHHRLDDVGEALQPDDESLLLAAQGQVVDEITVGSLLGMTWMPAGGNRQTSDLLMLSSTSLLEYNPNWGITTSTLAGGESLVEPVAVSSYFGNFYLLDPQANVLLRYLPTANGYSAAPESYFSPDLPVDLTNAIDFAIDGAIYVLFKDGHIAKYLSGQPVNEFKVNGLDKSLKNPVSIFTAPDEEVQHLYVADAGNQRVVQLNKDGSFVRQFKAREGSSFSNLQDIFVDEIGGRIFMLDSNNLYVGNISNE